MLFFVVSSAAGDRGVRGATTRSTSPRPSTRFGQCRANRLSGATIHQAFRSGLGVPVARSASHARLPSMTLRILRRAGTAACHPATAAATTAIAVECHCSTSRDA